MAGRLLRIIGLAVVAAALGACSAVRLGYNNLPEIAYWWLDGYVDFSDTQSPRVRDDLAQIQRWHRSTELPRIEQLLRRLETLAPGDVTPAQVCSAVGEMRDRLRAVAVQSEPAVTLVALELAPSQLDAIRKKFAKVNADYRKDWIDAPPEKQRDKRLKVVVERSEMVYGRLSDAQRDAVRAHIAKSSFNARESHAESLRRQQDLLETVTRLSTTRPGLADARNAIHGLFARAFESPDARYRAYQETLVQEGCESLAAAHNTATPEQRDNAVKRLRAYGRDAQELQAPR